MITTPSDYIKRLEAIQQSVSPTIETIHLGTEPLFIINTDTREITVPPAMHQLGVVSDHNAETIYLQIDRYFDDADLSQKTCVIQYINAADEKHLYPIAEKYIDEEKGKLTFAWKLSGNVTKAAGIISFSVRFYEIENDSYLYNFNTKTASFMISDGLDIREDMSIVPSPTDIIILVEHLDQVTAQTANDAHQTSEDRVRVESLVDSVVQTITDKKDGAVKEINTTTSNQIGKIDSEGTAQINKIQQKGNDTLESIPNDYTQLSNGVSDLKHKDIRNSSMFSNALIGKVTGEGQIVISDAANAAIPCLEIDGASEQMVTTGAQLLDIKLPSATTNSGVTVSLSGDGGIHLRGTATATGNHRLVDPVQNLSIDCACATLSLQTSGAYDGVVTVADASEEKWKYLLSAKNSAASNGIVKTSKLGCYATYIAGTTYNVTLYPMLNIGPTALPWEPYTGGKPSPSPDYPQEIVSVAHVANSGAQLFDDSKIQTRSIGGATVTNNGDGSFIVSGNGELTEDFSVSVKLTREETVKLFHAGDYTLSGNRTYPYVFVKLEGDSNQSTEWNLLGNAFTKTVTQDVIENENITARLGFYGYARGTIVPGTSKPMLNAGSTPIPWEPYNGQKRVIDLEVTSTGMNLFDAGKLSVSAGIDCTVAKSGKTITVSGSKAFCNAATDIPIHWIAGKKIFLSGEIISTNKSIRATAQILTTEADGEHYYSLDTSDTQIINVPSDVRKASLKLYPNNTVNPLDTPNIVTFRNIMVSYYASTTWEPYTGYHKVIIPLAEPLRGIGDVKDRLCMRDGVGGIERNIGKVDNSQWKIRNVKEGNKGHRFAYVSDSIPTFPNFKVQSTKYRQELKSSFEVAGDYISTDEKNTHAIFIRTLEKDFETEAEFCEWMTDAETIYPLATPIWEPFPEDVQAALNALTPRPGTTYLTVTSTNVAAPMRLEYVQDINKVISQLYTTINDLKAATAK